MFEQGLHASDNVNDATGGWGDSSITGTQMSSKSTDMDRVTIPVTVATLTNLEVPAEKIQFGNFSFSQVRVVGEIVDVRENESKEIRYMIRDLGNEGQNPFLVVQFFGIDASNASTFFEGTLVHVVGKIRTFEDKCVLFAFKVVEVLDPDMPRIFHKEARVAQLYFTKNVPDLYAAGGMANFIGTFLSPEPPQSNDRNKNVTNVPFCSLFNNNKRVENGSAVYRATQSDAREKNPQQEKIVEYFKNYPVSSDEGHNFMTIKDALGGDPNFEDDINYLAQNGVIYTTIDDNHFALVNE